MDILQDLVKNAGQSTDDAERLRAALADAAEAGVQSTSPYVKRASALLAAIDQSAELTQSQNPLFHSAAQLEQLEADALINEKLDVLFEAGFPIPSEDEEAKC